MNTKRKALDPLTLILKEACTLDVTTCPLNKRAQEINDRKAAAFHEAYRALRHLAVVACEALSELDDAGATGDYDFPEKLKEALVACGVTP